ncbi:hypothetical protein [Paenibacillus polymyxa]|uniref:DUF7666 domain-containing protein n=1 Tax=Paenibacillus polymyxa (strain SC2) TaxID=886882 RepID=E3EK45_PAEPS|nr:hypothetical protein [Paenibacillus polymyxa]ADO59754.1 hypothetical protein PPSC2_26410 [Paenibacillus polymyxa SC2]WPQ60013.1 hypothetical protein SKN87_27605 [Paenibacillus polymyxa]
MKEKIKGYKAFEKGLVCRGFQYEEGKTFEHKGQIVPCSTGLHFCENPLDVLNHYPLIDSRGELSEFAEVEALGETKKVDDKSVTNQLRISAKLDLPEYINESCEFLRVKCAEIAKVNSENESQLSTSEDDIKLVGSGDYSQWAASGHRNHLSSLGEGCQLAASGRNSQLVVSGDYSHLAAAGHFSQLASTGSNSYLAASGDDSRLAASGDDSQLATSGDYSLLAASGDDNRLAASGIYSQLAATGNKAQLAASGNDSRLTALGNNCMVVSSGDDNDLTLDGKDSVGAAIGLESRIRSKVGNWITLAEWKCSGERYVPVCVKSAQIDGKILKEDTWYKLENGEFVECS